MAPKSKLLIRRVQLKGSFYWVYTRSPKEGFKLVYEMNWYNFNSNGKIGKSCLYQIS
jgi:hypothetical protein